MKIANKNNNDNNDLDIAKFLSRKFLMMMVVFVVASVFAWFGKITSTQVCYIWIFTGMMYGLWNVLQSFISSIKISDIVDIFTSLKKDVESIQDKLKEIGNEREF